VSAPCRTPGCLARGRGGLCPACARAAIDAELARAGWTPKQVRDAHRAAAERLSGLDAALGEGDDPLPPQGEA